MKKIYGVYFSPGGKTEKVVRTIAQALARALSGAEIEYVNITSPKNRQKKLEFKEEDFLLFGVPTYAGRVPNQIMPFIRDEVLGKNTLGAAVVTYGNRNFDDALKELSLLLGENGFTIIGGGAFVCEHSFAKEIAANRPKADDLRKAEELAAGICKKLEKKQYHEPKFPGNQEITSYYIPKKVDGTPAVFLKAKPKIKEKICIHCGKCVEICPMGSINREFETMGICIKCQACIKCCPVQARVFTDEEFLSHKAMLIQNFKGVEKKSELYI